MYLFSFSPLFVLHFFFLFFYISSSEVFAGVMILRFATRIFFLMTFLRAVSSIVTRCHCKFDRLT